MEESKKCFTSLTRKIYYQESKSSCVLNSHLVSSGNILKLIIAICSIKHNRRIFEGSYFNALLHNTKFNYLQNYGQRRVYKVLLFLANQLKNFRNIQKEVRDEIFKEE